MGALIDAGSDDLPNGEKELPGANDDTTNGGRGALGKVQWNA